jgi:hypothetical protein
VGTAACRRIVGPSGDYTLWPGDGLPVRSALPSELGDILLFAAGDIGHRKGLVAYT